jgi:hypothetical protein
MNKNQIIDTFNKHFMDFIIDIERVFPADTDIMSMRKSISKSLMLLPKTLIRMFNDYFVMNYSNEIENGDLTFFIENDYRIKHGYSQTDEVWVINKIDILREPVRNMSDEDKEKVIQYLKNLKKLSDLYNNLRKTNIKAK